MMARKIEPELREEIIRLHLEEGRTEASLRAEFGIGQGTLRFWLNKRSEECQVNDDVKSENDVYERNRKLQKELAELKKENEFLKKATAFFAKEIK